MKGRGPVAGRDDASTAAKRGAQRVAALERAEGFLGGAVEERALSGEFSRRNRSERLAAPFRRGPTLDLDMHLATFAVDAPTGPIERIGCRHEDSLLDLTAGYATLLADDGSTRPVRRAKSLAPPDMLEFLRNGPEAMEAAREVAAAAEDLVGRAAPDGASISYDVDAVDLRAPLPRPNTIRDFSVFEEHGREKPDEWYELPAYYKGNPDSVVAPGTDVAWPSYTDMLDFELELAAVVGQECRNVAAGDAETYLAGYTVFNDFSARDIQMEEMEMGLGPGKGKDFANGFGPYLVTPDEFDPTDAEMEARVDGELWAEGNSGEAYHSIGDMLAHASLDQTVHPGDVLGTGTVGGGCGADLDRWIERGDRIELEIEGIGTLEHRVV
jgi:2-keto-4-pentenoate hydratase/2-oxohepta-3-ene-1,7-dioic acid hydratase in catechol pathway